MARELFLSDLKISVEDLILYPFCDFIHWVLLVIFVDFRLVACAIWGSLSLDAEISLSLWDLPLLL